MFYGDDGVLKLIDFFPRPAKVTPTEPLRPQQDKLQDADADLTPSLRQWLVRRVECVRGEIDVNVVIDPAFSYARDSHIVMLKAVAEKAAGEAAFEAVFASRTRTIGLRAVVGPCKNLLGITSSETFADYTQQIPGDSDVEAPEVNFEVVQRNGRSDCVQACLHLREGQRVSFVLRDVKPDPNHTAEHITPSLLDRLQQKTKQFWFDWISQSTYQGRWQEVVQRSLLTLKLLTYEPTGAIVAAPTFSLPEAFGGGRNWDYRFSWVRDSSFTVYILLRMGFKQEAEAYMAFIMNRLKYNKTEEGGLPIMFSIHGDTDLAEVELPRLEGYRGSKPVRIGNGAAFHKQLDIYGELMDAIYLYNKYGKPISYDDWLAIRELTDFVCGVWQEKDMSIWEVRGEIQNFTYSKIMLWVAVDRALRLADKRCLPCPNRLKWLATRDEIMESVMEHGYNEKLKSFIQSYEHREALDSAVLIAPLVFFVAPNDPRFTNTLERILQPLERDGLTSAGMVYRYNTDLSDDGEPISTRSPSSCP
jgi:GH15 family glucan-1,4-alpha-glucosidase